MTDGPHVRPETWACRECGWTHEARVPLAQCGGCGATLEAYKREHGETAQLFRAAEEDGGPDV